MVNKDELTWQHMVHEESQQVALIKQMENNQQQEEYKESCVRVVEMLKELRKQMPNDEKFGEQVAKIVEKL